MTHRRHRLIGLVLIGCVTLPLSVAVGAHGGMPPSSDPVREVYQGRLTDLERNEPERLLDPVGKEHPVDPIDYEPDDLVLLDDGLYQLRAEAAEAVTTMQSAAADDGIRLTVISGYRSYDTQAGTFQDWVNRVGPAAAEARSARPGHSEHQLGLAVDLDDSQGCYLRVCFSQSPGGLWLAENAHQYGFLLSYPEWAADRTGFSYEPWHFRYVGPRAAAQMQEFELELLEDYLSAHGRGAGVGLALGRR